MPETNGHRPCWNAVAVRPDGRFCLVRVDAVGRIVASSAVSCVWSGTPRFHNWFLARWPLDRIELLPRRFGA